MSWHFLQEGEEESWEGNSLDGAPFALSRLIPTLEKSSLPVSEMESLNPSPSGTTLQPSTELHGEVPLTSLVEDSPAKILVQPERARESKGRKAVCGWKWQGSFVKYDPGTSSWRTRQCSLVEGLDVFSGTWPRWGTMQNGECTELTMLELRTSGTGFGLSLPTPTANEGGRNRSSSAGSAIRPSLGMMAKHNSWPTPRASDYKDTVKKSATTSRRVAEGTANLPEAMQERTNGGRLNPTWVEWLMGWPEGWTDLEPLEMGKFRQWLDLHGRTY